MANCQKYTRAACGHLFRHYERAKDENGEYIKFGNQDIDTDKSHLNYNLAPMQSDGQGGFVKERCSEVKMQNRKDVNVMCSWVVTAPPEIRADETEQFFKETYNFLSERYGKENIISAYVHMDETTPHIHFAFVPVVRCKKKDILKVSAKELINKFELKRFHDDLSDYMENIFGRDIGLMNEATKEGNKAIDELKRGTARQKLAEIKAETDELTEKKEQQTAELQAMSGDLKALKSEINNLEKQIKELDDEYASGKLTDEDLKKIKPTKGLFGRAKNIKYDDVVKLKSMAKTTRGERKALTGARRENKQLKDEKKALQQENAGLKAQIPTFKDKLKQNEREIKLKDLETENAGLRNLINRILAALPEREREIVNKIINPAPPKRRQSQNIE